MVFFSEYSGKCVLFHTRRVVCVVICSNDYMIESTPHKIHFKSPCSRTFKDYHQTAIALEFYTKF